VVVIADDMTIAYCRTIAQLVRCVTVVICYDGGMRETETVGPPWELELTREDGRLVEVVIRATGDELGFNAIREATDAVLSKLRRERPTPVGPSVLGPLRRAHQAADGKMTPEYLAQLAVTYSELAARGRAVMPALSNAIDRPAATVKGHVMKAREQGYLTDATVGREGGEPTAKALDLVKGAWTRGAET
jgi:hypothetical protein